MSVVTVVGFVLALTTYSAAQTGPAIVVRPPANTVAWTGQTVRLTCVAYGSPLPTVTWTSPNGNTLTDSSPSVQISAEVQTFNGKAYTVSTIALCGVTTSMTGQYSCAATGGSSSSGITSNVASFFLQVSTPDTDAAAVVVRPTATNTVNEMSVVEFVCIAYGKPLPVITWSRSNIPNITSNTLANANVTTQTIIYGDVTFQKSVLQLCSVSRRDQDNAYMCKADNGVSGNGITADSAIFGLTVNPLSSSSSSSTTSSPSPSSESQPLANLASETAYQAVVAILVVIVVVLIVAVAITFVWLLLIHKKGREDVTLMPAPSRPQPASNPTFEDDNQEIPDDEAIDALQAFDDIDDDKEELVS